MPCPAIPRAARASYGRAGSPEKATKWRVRGRRGHGKHRQHARRRVSAPLATCARERAHQNLHMAMRNVTGGVRIETNYMPVWVCHSRQSQRTSAGTSGPALSSCSLGVALPSRTDSWELDIRFAVRSMLQATAGADSDLRTQAGQRSTSGARKAAADTWAARDCITDRKPASRTAGRSAPARTARVAAEPTG